jgi:predicted RNA-binding Zn-ribbon protein involved in translation (DUF1610 family)
MYLETPAMPTTQTNADPTLDQADQLYWNSAHRVDDIASELGMGRSALYAAIHPMSAGTECPRCGKPMVFTNRTNRTAGRAVCSSCGTQGVAAAAAEEETPLAQTHDEWRPEGHLLPMDRGGSIWSRWREDFSTVEPQRAVLVGGGAALGVMVGAAAARAVREMI